MERDVCGPGSGNPPSATMRGGSMVACAWVAQNVSGGSGAPAWL